mmetsp:Transcript_19272/g.33266  ORF Transcript_19272/g.33266 Transcript_19272/m.33266 type:complete len:247 (-) Transcript_19272:197-937(-)
MQRQLHPPKCLDGRGSPRHLHLWVRALGGHPEAPGAHKRKAQLGQLAGVRHRTRHCQVVGITQPHLPPSFFRSAPHHVHIRDARQLRGFLEEVAALAQRVQQRDLPGRASHGQHHARQPGARAHINHSQALCGRGAAQQCFRLLGHPLLVGGRPVVVDDRQQGQAIRQMAVQAFERVTHSSQVHRLVDLQQVVQVGVQLRHLERGEASSSNSGLKGCFMIWGGSRRGRGGGGGCQVRDWDWQSTDK